MFLINIYSIRKEEFSLLLCCSSSPELPSWSVHQTFDAIGWSDVPAIEEIHLCHRERRCCFLSQAVCCSRISSLWYYFNIGQFSDSIICKFISFYIHIPSIQAFHGRNCTASVVKWSGCGGGPASITRLWARRLWVRSPRPAVVGGFSPGRQIQWFSFPNVAQFAEKTKHTYRV